MVGIDAYNRDAYNNFVSTTIMSFARIIEQELTRKILYKPEWYFKMNPKSLMQFSLSEKTAFVKDMLSIGLLNRNEGRAEFDYSPVDVEGIFQSTLPVWGATFRGHGKSAQTRRFQSTLPVWGATRFRL